MDNPEDIKALSLLTELSGEPHFYVRHVSRLFTDNTGRFPMRRCSGNQYIMVS